MKHALMIALLLGLTNTPAWAASQQAAPQQAAPAPVAVLSSQQVPPDAASAEPQQEFAPVIVVGGLQPGPRLWRVKKGEHTLYILGTVAPLPNTITWDSTYVQTVLARSQEVIYPPYLNITAKVGIFRGLMLAPAYFRAQKNPNDAKLKDVLPPALYERWLGAKARYLPNADLEDKRPILVSRELYTAALKSARLGGKAIISPVVSEAVKKHGLKTTETAIKVTIEDPKQALKEVQATTFNEADCLRETLDSIDQRLPGVVQRANAWATGDVAALRQAATAKSNGPSCIDALSEAEFARKRGIVDVPQRLKANWLAAAEKALDTNAVTFGTLGMEDLAQFLPALKGKGYEVIDP